MSETSRYNAFAPPTEAAALTILLLPGPAWSHRRRVLVTRLATATALRSRSSSQAFEQVEAAFKSVLDKAGPPPGWSPTDAEDQQ